MKIELKQLTGYLPYGLKGNLENLDYYDTVMNKELYRIETGKTENSKTYDVMVIVGDEEGNISDFKPILRPLSDLTKEIEVNGNRFLPAEILFSIDNSEIDDFKLYGTMPNYWKDALKIKPRYYDFWQIQFLYEWHFDIHGLIEKGLAIDINTIKP